MLQMMEDLLKWGFIQHRFDPCLFMLRKSDSDYTLVCLYVADMSVTYTNSVGNSTAYDSFMDQLMKRYRCSQSDDRDVYLGIRIRRTAPGHYSMVFTASMASQGQTGVWGRPGDQLPCVGPARTHSTLIHTKRT